MTNKERDTEIIKLHKGTKDKKGLTYSVLSKKYGVTSARIGQICSPKEKVYYHCKRHNKRFTKKCPFCEIDDNYLATLDDPSVLKAEIEFLSIPNRNQKVVRKKKILVIKLIDELCFSSVKVGKLLGIDHTSVLNLYKGFNKK